MCLEVINLLQMASCLFCQIVAGERPADRVYEDSEVLVFKDIKPAAKHHYLVIPKRHMKNAKSLTSEDVDLGE